MMGWLAVATGVVGLLAAAFIFSFFSVGPPFGTLNDVFNALLAILSAVLAWMLFSGQLVQSTPLGRVMLVVAVAGALMAVVGSALVLSGVTGWYLGGLYLATGSALIGLWLLGLSLLIRREASTSPAAGSDRAGPWLAPNGRDARRNVRGSRVRRTPRNVSGGESRVVEFLGRGSPYPLARLVHNAGDVHPQGDRHARSTGGESLSVRRDRRSGCSRPASTFVVTALAVVPSPRERRTAEAVTTNKEPLKRLLLAGWPQAGRHSRPGRLLQAELPAHEPRR
jgi:hypothetical protein